MRIIGNKRRFAIQFAINEALTRKKFTFKRPIMYGHCSIWIDGKLIGNPFEDDEMLSIPTNALKRSLIWLGHRFYQNEWKVDGSKVFKDIYDKYLIENNSAFSNNDSREAMYKKVLIHQVISGDLGTSFDPFMGLLVETEDAEYLICRVHSPNPWIDSMDYELGKIIETKLAHNEYENIVQEFVEAQQTEEIRFHP